MALTLIVNSLDHSERDHWFPCNVTSLWALQAMYAGTAGTSDKWLFMFFNSQGRVLTPFLHYNFPVIPKTFSFYDYCLSNSMQLHCLSNDIA